MQQLMECWIQRRSLSTSSLDIPYTNCTVTRYRHELLSCCQPTNIPHSSWMAFQIESQQPGDMFLIRTSQLRRELVAIMVPQGENASQWWTSPASAWSVRKRVPVCTSQTFTFPCQSAEASRRLSGEKATQATGSASSRVTRLIPVIASKTWHSIPHKQWLKHRRVKTLVPLPFFHWNDPDASVPNSIYCVQQFCLAH